MTGLLPLLFVAMPLFAVSPTMSTDERSRALQYLTESRREFLAAIDGVSEVQWRWKPSPERWSVGEVAEHIVLAEASLFGAVRRAMSSPANAEWEEKTKGKTELIERVMAPRMGKAQAPESIVPKGTMTLAQVHEQFEKQRVEIEKFASSTDAPVKEHTVEHPFPFFGTLNAYQWLIYIPLHTERHDKQIAEVKATAGYPK